MVHLYPSCLAVLLSVCALASPMTVDQVSVPQDSRNDSPTLAFSRDGTLWLAWSSLQDGKRRLAVASRKGDEWSAIAYPDESDTEQLEPVFAFASDRPPCLVYTAYDQEEWNIRMVEKGEGGWKKPASLGHGVEPTAAAVPKGCWIAWIDDPDIVMLSPDGEKTVLKPGGHFSRLSHPVLVGGPDGSVWLAWDAAQPGYQSVRVKRLDKAAGATLVADSGTGVNRHPRLSVDAKGRVWLVFESLLPSEDPRAGTSGTGNGPVYEYERRYTVTKPSMAVLVTDGEIWMKPQEPTAPAFGLMPSLIASGEGTVWLLSRRMDRFYPLCESLGPKGWENHRAVWGDRSNYKVHMALAEAPDGQVWAAWPRHFRPRTKSREAPGWSILDGPDTIVISIMPECDSPGEPRLTPFEKSSPTPPVPVRYPRYTTEYGSERLNVYFGDLHVHSEVSGCGRRNGSIDQNLYYSRDIRNLDFYAPGDHAEHTNDHNWHTLRMATLKHDRPGEFVPFMGFEWTSEFDGGGNLFRGHYNPVFRQIGRGDFYFSASDPRYNTPLELWTALRAAVGGPENVLTFAHHTSRRNAWLSWNYYDPEMAPLIEIAQTRGSYEYDGCFSGLKFHGDCGRVRGHFIQDGLGRGMRFGLVANGDHAGRQLTGVFCSELKRDAVFDALRAKRTFATDGERMFLDVRVDGHFMGEEYKTDKHDREVTVTVKGTLPLAQIDLYRNGRVIRSWYPYQSQDLKAEYADQEPLFRRENYYYVRALQKGGGQAWSSPTWVINPQLPGEFMFQVGGDELRVIYPELETDFAVLMHNETEGAVQGTVYLDLPIGWSKREDTIQVNCPPGAWMHAVFNVTAPDSDLGRLHLPEVTARFQYENGRTLESPLFVVASPHFVTRQQKAQLIDAKTDIPPAQFPTYVEEMARIWASEGD